MEAALADLKKSFESKDLEKIDKDLEKLNEAGKQQVKRCTRRNKSNSFKGSNNQQKTDAPKDDSENVEDVEFEEVKD